MAKLVLRCKNARHLFVKNINGNSVSFTENLEEAYCGGGDFVTIENLHYYNDLCRHLFEIYEVPKSKYVIKVVGVELYLYEPLYARKFFVDDKNKAAVFTEDGKSKFNKIQEEFPNVKLEVVKL